MSSDTPETAIIGGSGFYTFLDDPRQVSVETPYGPPSSSIAIGTLRHRGGERTVAFLPRHGRNHEFPAHRVNYRANMWALRSLGVRQILAPCAVGGLQPDLGPGIRVVPDQLVDRTYGRAQTYFDVGAGHVSFADPYCPRLRSDLLNGMADFGAAAVDGGTMVVIEGPRFSTRAESQWYSAQGWSVVNMTGQPEAVLARELELCYATIALVTDVDAGISSEQSVDQREVFRVFSEHTDELKAALKPVLLGLSSDRSCRCPAALEGLDIQLELP